MFSANSSQVSNDANYIEDTFSTYLYTGNGSTQTITNGIDLAGKGGLTWIKARSSSVRPHILVDTVRGAPNTLQSNSTAASTGAWSTVTGFTSSGFTIGTDSYVSSSDTYASWTFRKQPKFFDVVTFTTASDGSATVSHNLGATPGCVITKCTGTTSAWSTWHRSLSGTNYEVRLNSTAAETNIGTWINPSSTQVQFISGTLIGSQTYVAYIFAHNAGGFGLTGTDNVISCGSFTADASGNSPAITLGYEPQWMMFKPTSTTGNWTINDVMRGWSQTAIDFLYPNTSAAETELTGSYISPSATGTNASSGGFIANATYIYIAIRRGPMKVPTDGTKVFNPYSYSGDGTNSKTLPSVGFVPDWSILTKTNSGSSRYVADRLRGGSRHLDTAGTGAEFFSSQYGVQVFGQSAVTLGTNDGTDGFNQSGNTFINYSFLRAPSFFDEVCYTGDGTSNRAIPHNLTAMPELIISKKRSAAGEWYVWCKYYSYALGTAPSVYCVGALQDSMALNGGYSETQRFSPVPTASNIYTGSITSLNNSGDTYVSYLFATCAGVSKCGTFTGTGTTQQINCGFTGGARFVLIKRTDSTGSWYVWDVARGIVSGNDPYLLLNSTAAEVTNTDYIDTYSAGFEISSTAPSEINASGGTFIFLAIA